VRVPLQPPTILSRRKRVRPISEDGWEVEPIVLSGRQVLHVSYLGYLRKYCLTAARVGRWVDPAQLVEVIDLPVRSRPDRTRGLRSPPWLKWIPGRLGTRISARGYAHTATCSVRAESLVLSLPAIAPGRRIAATSRTGAWPASGWPTSARPWRTSRRTYVAGIPTPDTDRTTPDARKRPASSRGGGASDCVWRWAGKCRDRSQHGSSPS
jgi:hypothetical protein